MNQTLLLSAVYSAIDKVSGPVKKMTQAVGDFEKMTQRGKGLQEWGTKVAVGAAMLDAAGSKIKKITEEMAAPFFELDQQMTLLEQNIKSLGKNQVASLAAAKKAAQEWEQQHRGSAASFIEMTSKMSAAGLKDVDAIRATRQALTLSQATMSDHNTASDLLITSYQIMSDRTRDTTAEMKKHADMTAKVQKIYSMQGWWSLLSELAA